MANSVFFLEATFYIIGDDHELQTNSKFVTYIQWKAGPLERKIRDHHIIEDVMQTTPLLALSPNSQKLLSIKNNAFGNYSNHNWSIPYVRKTFSRRTFEVLNSN